MRLEPLLRPAHAPHLFAIGRDEATWRYMPTPVFGNEVDAARWVTTMLDHELAGTRVLFAIRRLTDQRIVGSTSLFDFRAPERALEIGFTWLAPEACRTSVNTAVKLLLLTHCFEHPDLAYRRVPLKTDARNLTSQRAIERLGATREGTLRRHLRLHDGFQRDSVFYSILPSEWPPIKARLPARLEQA
ncbi:MAG: GNAT family N-acetyltransferase [Candidatus Synoicihabitans palmerolidicus]|nr:GNAT family N-acetyltransferase [Candidatus Synoicihabitans palmerolidicus]